MFQLLYPLVFAIYPIVFLYARYVNDANNIFWYFCLSIIAGSVVIAVHYLGFSRNKAISREHVRLKTILGSSMMIVLIISFGHVYNEFYQLAQSYWLDRRQNVAERDMVILVRQLVSLLCLLLLFFSYRFLARAKIALLQDISKVVFIFSMCLLVLPIFSLGTTLLFSKNELQELSEYPSEWVKSLDGETCDGCKPDVYYIILDGYARADILERFYGFDNDKFLNSLNDLDFAVVADARSNYFTTFLSLSSSLNMNYIEDVFEDFDLVLDEASMERHMLGEAIRNNRVAQEFRSRGYQYVHMASTWGMTRNNPYADIEYDCNTSAMQNDFDRVFIEGTVFSLFSSQASVDIARCHLSNFQWLGEVAPGIEGPKFVFAHFIQPHHPYLFDSQGKILRFASLSDQFELQRIQWGNREAYVEQLQFVNNKILEIVRSILKRSKQPPIIIIQSDHGSLLYDKQGDEIKNTEDFDNARTGILLAVYTPDKQKRIPVKTPVNLFRYLFSSYAAPEASDKMELLPDKILKSNYISPYIFKELDLD